MSARIHGIASLLLTGAAYGTALAVLLQASVLAGSIYAAILMISLTAIIYSYCGKCLCRMGACAHILPGLITGFHRGGNTVSEHNNPSAIPPLANEAGFYHFLAVRRYSGD